jgi:hypothetical protein
MNRALRVSYRKLAFDAQRGAHDTCGWVCLVGDGEPSMAIVPSPFFYSLS